MPSPYSVTVPEEILNNSFLENLVEISEKILNLNKEELSRYDLRDKYDIEVKNQGITPLCWADSLLSSIEMNLKIKQNINVNLSEEYLNYATSTSFKDGKNEMAFNREAKDGGSTLIGLASLTNGQGAITDDKMVSTNNLENISLNDINVKPDFYVKGYSALPIICKNTENGNLIYTDGYGKKYTLKDVEKIRRIIKEYIVENGAITSYTASSEGKYYNNQSIFSSNAYFCNDSSIPVDHAVTIIGWDDNYSKDNFTGAVKPNNDGAYIVLNSYSDKNFDDGYLYISYEDVWIESMLYGINQVSRIDYDNLYQHNEFGANIPITITKDNNRVKEGYYANIYKRKTNNLEVLNQISIPTNQYAKFEIYVNSNGTDLNINNLKKVATTDILNPGYNTINFDDVILNGKEFAVVVKQVAVEDEFYCMLETRVDGTFWENVCSDAGNSKISIDGIEWKNLDELESFDYEGYEVKLSQADVCIKAFTKVLPKGENTMKLEQVSYIEQVTFNNYMTFKLLNDFILRLGIFHDTINI